MYQRTTSWKIQGHRKFKEFMWGREPERFGSIPFNSFQPRFVRERLKTKFKSSSSDWLEWRIAFTERTGRLSGTEEVRQNNIRIRRGII